MPARTRNEHGCDNGETDHRSSTASESAMSKGIGDVPRIYGIGNPIYLMLDRYA